MSNSKTALDIKPYQCGFCQKIFTLKNNLTIPRSFVCPTCCENLIQKSDEYKKTLNSCPNCEYRGLTKYYLRVHIMRQHSGELRHFCSFCNKGFLVSSSLKSHIKAKHPVKKESVDGEENSKKKYECEICKKVFAFKQSLRKHIKIHRGAFVCSVCKRGFENENDMQLHKARDCKKPFYQCSFCEYSTSRSHEMSTHMSNHILPHRCLLCSKGYETEQQLNSHIQKVHIKKTNEKGDNENKKHCCTKCDYSSDTKYNLSLHLRTHSGERPYECELCGKSFTQKGTLMCHLRVHTGEQAFVCSFCPKGFNRKAYLLHHEKMHHKEAQFEAVGKDR